jgi:chaperonin GroEL
VKKALQYPLRLIANNAGSNGAVVMNKVMDAADPNWGFNAETSTYEDLMKAGIIDPTKVIRCALENSASVARTFLTADVVVTEIPEQAPVGGAADPGMGGY